MCGKRGSGYEGNEDEEEPIKTTSAATSSTLTTVSTVPAPVDDFMHTLEFKISCIPFVHEQSLTALRILNKEWNGVADVLIDEGVKSCTMMVHDGMNIICGLAYARNDERKLVTRVVFLLNITKVRQCACWAANLVVVDIPEGVERIGDCAFYLCESLTNVYFATALKNIGRNAFRSCSSFKTVDLLHTNLQEIGYAAFQVCSELKSMTIPDSFQTIGKEIFYICSKLVPSNIHTYDRTTINGTSEVVAHLCSQQLLLSTATPESTLEK
ncbi:hypothetical protein TL16_g10468 [Triparma laevis f. inornata]|uniref:Uncharacterized protein n=1 Tax=Triparma laevis f. inornata TaxID=1714386 RepID=A0A9W7B8H3_9STRA|nr:hypothetical protein TL16_g10468 [Triparma laevis f. inornata]